MYKYDWVGKSLTNPELLVDLPAEPGPYHNGGKLKIGHKMIASTGIGHKMIYDHISILSLIRLNLITPNNS